MLFCLAFCTQFSLRMPRCFFLVRRSGAGSGRVEWHVTLFKGCYTPYCTSSLHLRTHSARSLSNTTSQLQRSASNIPTENSPPPPSSQPCSKAAPPNSVQAPSSLARLLCQTQCKLPALQRGWHIGHIGHWQAKSNPSPEAIRKPKRRRCTSSKGALREVQALPCMLFCFTSFAHFSPRMPR